MDVPFEALTAEQGPDESVDEFWARLKVAARRSGEFWPDFLLRDVFVRGLRSPRCRRALEIRTGSSSASALEFARDWEECERVCYPVLEDGPCARIVTELEVAGVPRDLAHEIADLVEEVHQCVFLAKDPNLELYENKVEELEALLSGHPLRKERNETWALNLEPCRVRIGPLQLRPAGNLFKIPLPTPQWMLKLNEKLPNNIILPANM